MAETTLDRLLVDHLGDIDDSVARVYGLQAIVGKAIGGFVEDWAGSNNWRVDGDDWDDDDISIYLEHWKGDEEKNFPKITLDFGAGDNGDLPNDYFWLTRLCRAGKGQVGFRFYPGFVKKPNGETISKSI